LTNIVNLSTALFIQHLFNIIYYKVVNNLSYTYKTMQFALQSSQH